VRAVQIDAFDGKSLVLAEVSEPVPAPMEMVVKVEAFSLNLGEVRRALTQPVPGWRPGWDFAGTVVTAAAQGDGPQPGARVVGFVEEGAWAERIAVAPRAVAEIPASVSLSQAATLPVAGLTALRALEHGGLLAGKKVLINGASGGVGHFASQLAQLGGAHVVAAVRREMFVDQVLEDGAHHVVVDATLEAAREFGPFDLILESVGGTALVTALTMLASTGVCVTYGNSSRGTAAIDVSTFYTTDRARLQALFLVKELREVSAGVGLAKLLSLVENRRLTPRIDFEGSWRTVDAVARQLFNREISGKAVLTVD
jgi:NADPH:quinone reductase-like Zn-dependent oxidoreductase